MEKVRDTQRSKLYAAEHALDKIEGACDMLPEMEDLQKFLKKFHASTWVQKKYGKRRIQVRDGRRRRSAGAVFYSYSGNSYIFMPRWSRKVYIVLHEISHCVCDWQTEKNKEPRAHHGPQFAGIYLQLVKHFCGKEAYNVLKASFREHGVRFRPKRVRNLTDEQREKLRERGRALAVARRARLEAVATILAP